MLLINKQGNANLNQLSGINVKSEIAQSALNSESSKERDIKECGEHLILQIKTGSSGVKRVKEEKVTRVGGEA